MNEEQDLPFAKLREYTPENLKQYVKNGKFTVRFPKVIRGSFDCSGLGLVSLVGVPKVIRYHFDCGLNDLTSLYGSPEYVGGHFDCRYNLLTTLEYAPKIVRGCFNCLGNKQDFTKEDLPANSEICRFFHGINDKIHKLMRR